MSFSALGAGHQACDADYVEKIKYHQAMASFYEEKREDYDEFFRYMEFSLVFGVERKRVNKDLVPLAPPASGA